MCFMLVLYVFLVFSILVTRSVPDDVDDGDKFCYIIDHNREEDVRSPLVPKTVQKAFVELHKTMIDELCKHVNVLKNI